MHHVSRNDYVPTDRSSAWESWRGHIAPFFDLSPRSETILSDRLGMTTFHLDSMLVGEVRAPAQDLSRPSLKIAQQGVDHIVMQFYMTGRSQVRSGTREAIAGRTDAVIYDLSQEVDVRSDQPVDAINILFPRDTLATEIPGIDRLHGLCLDHEANAAARLFRDYITGLARCGADLQAQQLPGLNQAALKLCSAFLGSSTGGNPVSSTGARMEIRDFIHRNIADPELGVDLITQRFGISRPVLYRQFSEEGGIQTYIRERRLLKAMRLLTRPGPKGRPRVSNTAYAVGFLDEKSFSRAFRNRFGYLPSEARAGEVGDISGENDGLLAWIKDLAA